MMGEKFSRRVSADHLWTEDDIADSIAARMDEADDDPSFIAHALGVVARAPNLYRLARDTGLTRDGLYEALSADGDPSNATVGKVAGALGLKVSLTPARRAAT